MPIEIGDEVEIPDPDDEDSWLRARLVRRGTDAEALERPSRVPGGSPIRIPVWILEITAGPRAGESISVPNGTIVRISL